MLVNSIAHQVTVCIEFACHTVLVFGVRMGGLQTSRVFRVSKTGMADAHTRTDNNAAMTWLDLFIMTTTTIASASGKWR